MIVEGMVPNAGTTLDWLCNTFYRWTDKEKALGMLLQEAEEAPKGAHGMCFVNALTGTGTPEWNPLEKGSFTNILLQHTREDFARAGIGGDYPGCSRLRESCGSHASGAAGKRYQSIGRLVEIPVSGRNAGRCSWKEGFPCR